MEKKRMSFALLILISVLLLSHPCQGAMTEEKNKSLNDPALVSPSNENHPPFTPSQPQGPQEGDAGETYLYWSTSTDPDGDQLFYYFNWGDASESGWLGPYDSGSRVNTSHIWHERGAYTIIVNVKDTSDAESNWSAPFHVVISGPYLTFGAINGGFGLTIEIKNIGENDAKDINVAIETTNGIVVKSIPSHYQIPLLKAGNSTQYHVRLWGVGCGLFANLPKVTLTAEAPESKTRGKEVQIRILGPFVKKVGETWVADESFNGYTIYTPMMSTKTFLIDNHGVTVHSWECGYKPALSVYLLENGNILRTAFPRFNPRFWGGGIGGRVELLDWNGTCLWYYEYSTDQHCLHHDVKMLPNGNILMIAWEYESEAEAVSAGRNPNVLPQGEFWPDHIIEVNPIGSSGGSIVWEWHLWDHLIQDFDPTKENYGDVHAHPELVDVNYGGKLLADWTHMNSIDYNVEYDQILVSVLAFDEIWIIDHSTTTEEAAGHIGGRYGKGGDLLYRWGNPLTYRRGSNTDRTLFNQHDAEWIKPGLPGAGNILIFNNGPERPSGDYSSVEEITPPMTSNGTYVLLPGTSYGPASSFWNYTATNPVDFYAVNLGGAQRLPNGNTLICDGPHGRFFEVTIEKEVVWEYENQVPDPLDSHVFRIYRYGPEYPGLRFL